MKLIELQIDRLGGPTHHFGGLGVGNRASILSSGKVSHPAAAARQGLDKMRLVASLGVPQWILPPQPRPDIEFLRRLGFAGCDRDVLQRAAETAPQLLSAAASSAACWTANAATVTPGIDSGQSATHVTVANLQASPHRSIEPPTTVTELTRVLGKIVTIHAPLPGGSAISDEGAANHLRLCGGAGQPGINVFVHGDGDRMPAVYPPRQTRAASQAVARLHNLPSENTFFLQQHPRAIDAGAFHNDVVAISHQHRMIHHQHAFLHADLERLEKRFAELTGQTLLRIEVAEAELSLADAVATYLFNSQIVTPHDPGLAGESPVSGAATIICPAQVENHPAARRLVQRWTDEGLFTRLLFVDLNQSMAAGGGPACLRLRIPLDSQQLPPSSPCQWNESLDQQLRDIIDRDYPVSLTLAELAREDFHAHARATTAKLRQLLLAGPPVEKEV